MTEKRFKVEKQIFDGYCIVDNTIDGYYTYEKQDLEKLCNSLNNLNDENEQLKQLLKIADDLINWNTVPQCRRNWEQQKEELLK